MTAGKWLLIAAAIGGGVHVWHNHERSVIERDLSAKADTYGFVPVVTPEGAPRDTAVILAALNCPSAQAKRADDLASQLTGMGIPTQRANNYSVAIVSREQQEILTQTNAVLSGTIPIVIVNGMAKANPTLDDVVAEYRRSK